MYSYNELKAATNGFRASNKIGEGGFGSVYKVKKKCPLFLGDVGFVFFLFIFVDWLIYVLFGAFLEKGKLQGGTFMAVKVLSVELESMRGEREFVSEIAALSDIKHENLVNLRGCCVDGAHRLLVYDYMENNSLSLTFLGNFLVLIAFVVADSPTCLGLRRSCCCLLCFGWFLTCLGLRCSSFYYLHLL